MCGIVGMISRKPVGFMASDMDLMENLLVLDTMRGLDSTGVYAIDGQKNVGIMKLASNPFHLFACEDWKKYRGRVISQGRIIIGHNRKATQGAINSNNAHPFHEGNIILVHNGTLRGGHKKLADVDVDSHAVCHAFNAVGAENVLPEIDGAFAFVWWDIEKGKLFAIRNDERPLNMVITDDLIVLASEAWMAHGLLARQGKKVVETVSLEVGQLYEFEHRTGAYTKTKIKLKELPVYQNNYQGGTWGFRGGDACGLGKSDRPHVTGNTTGGGTSSALTLVKGMQNPPFTPSNIPPNQGVFFPCNAEIRVVMKNVEIMTPSKQFLKITGTVMEPGLPEIDVVCNERIPKDSDPEEALHTMNTLIKNHYMTCLINSYHVSTCGPSVYVRELAPEKMVRVHNGKVGSIIWDHIVSVGKCKGCMARIFEEEAEFCIVGTGKNPDVTCPDCVEDKLPLGDIKNEFHDRRANAVQNGKPVRNQPTSRIVDGIEVIDSPTIH